MAGDEQERWYWCMDHQRPEREGECRAERRLGPYASEQDARDWRAQTEARNRRWDAEDERWEN